MATRVTDRAGQVLGGRYRLVAPIGTGASASVYLAEDTTLRRQVAVKVLHDALADDDAFLRRFQAEAHAAAALNHPHVMSVYDWSRGGEGEVAYLVMEYLSGGNLKSLLDGGYRLTLSQALLVGLEAARGLDYAHRRGFVHRDVKPANLLFDEEGRLRIADFGLARALAEAAWTEPMGAVLGTARYASPEQARGERLDGRSDVYSLALVLVECVTGIVPFAADTTLGTLMARVDKLLPVPDELGPLAPVLRAAGVPDPAERIDADDLGRALLRVAEELDPPRPLPLVHTVPHEVATPEPDDITAVIAPGAAAFGVAAVGLAGTDDVVGAAIADTDHEGIVVVPDDQLAQDVAPPLTRAERRAARREARDVEVLEPSVDDAVRADDAALYEPATWATPTIGGRPATAGPSGAIFDYEVDGDVDSDLGLAATAAMATTAGGEAGVDGGGGRGRRGDRPRRGTRPPSAKRTRRKVLVVLLVVVLLLGLGAGAAGYYTWRFHEVPTFTGQPIASVQATAADNGWVVARSDRYQDATTAGTVLEQSPAAGERLGRDETITVVVSLGPPPVAVPADLAGKPLLEAGASLDAAGLVPGTLARTYDEEVPLDHVISVAPGTPAELPKGSAVDLIVSDGPEPRTVPSDLLGRSQADVTAELEGLGLVVAPVEQPDENVAKGKVFWIDPEPGTQIPKGDTVRIGVSTGPPMVTVPDVSGMSVVEAADALEAAGLVVEGTQGSPRRDVQRTNPAAGTSVRKGSSVTIITGLL